jgi:hypothetical protein
MEQIRLRPKAGRRGMRARAGTAPYNAARCCTAARKTCYGAPSAPMRRVGEATGIYCTRQCCGGRVADHGPSTTPRQTVAHWPSDWRDAEGSRAIGGASAAGELQASAWSQNRSDAAARRWRIVGLIENTPPFASMPLLTSRRHARHPGRGALSPALAWRIWSWRCLLFRGQRLVTGHAGCLNMDKGG